MWPFGRSKPKLQQRVKDAHELIIGLAEKTTPALLATTIGDDWQNQAANQFAPMRVECLMFQLHLTDRLVNARLREHRAEFMDTLLPLTYLDIPNELQASFEETYNNRQQLYGSCKKVYADKDEAFRGTLMWEFGKAITYQFCGEIPVDKVMGVVGYGALLLESLDTGYKVCGVLN